MTAQSMSEALDAIPDPQELLARIEELERKVAALEAARDAS